MKGFRRILDRISYVVLPIHIWALALLAWPEGIVPCKEKGKMPHSPRRRWPLAFALLLPAPARAMAPPTPEPAMLAIVGGVLVVVGLILHLCCRRGRKGATRGRRRR